MLTHTHPHTDYTPAVSHIWYFLSSLMCAFCSAVFAGEGPVAAEGSLPIGDWRLRGQTSVGEGEE